MNRWLLGCAVLFSACPEQTATGVFAPLGEVRPNATADEKATFERGRAVALRRFTAETGLGPTINVTSCAACHERPTVGGSAGRYRNFSLIAQVLPDQSFQFLGKGGVLAHYDEPSLGRTLTPAEENVMASRNPIPMFGTGLLAEIPDEEILSREDVDDADHDGISGKANYDRGFVGRFGRKAQTVSIEGFIRGPLFNHAGITTDPLTDDARAKLPVPSNDTSGTRSFNLGAAPTRVGKKEQAQAAAPDVALTDDDGVADPELAPQDLFDVVSYAMLLAAPEAEPETDATAKGRQAFVDLRCAACHTPALKGPRGLIPAYSDLLLHDMGEELADGIVMKLAVGSEFRTQPLWGIAAVGPYLHDGRADTLDDAIRLHGGEGKGARDAYVAATEATRQSVLDFLESLGGRAQKSDGLLVPGAAEPAVGEYGAPGSTLSGADAARFAEGRHVFDTDFALAAGLGPTFNGDSCRACHFDPVIGGAGPSDVNVTRQGFVAADLTFTTPSVGTMLHKLSAAPGHRPEPEAMSNFFEERQPPALFGLGLVDRIPDATILALADPQDADGDGVRGRAHVLPDGRLGKLGWKANVPSVAEFSRDAMSNELGLTLPAQQGLTFGRASDDDGFADPELPLEKLEAVTFFMEQLAPPPRTSTDHALEARGEQLFGTAGCGTCHRPTLQTSDGVDVHAFSDFLLHEVGDATARGIGDEAKTTEFRTTPLWGLAKTAPYWHDGRAATVRQAVLLHQSEAAGARAKFEALPADDQAAVLAFLESL